MKKQDKRLYHLFRNNQHKLATTPNQRVWQNLEWRLDEHRRRQRMQWRKTISMAAAVVLLLGFVSLLNWISKSQHTQTSLDQAPLQIEQLQANNSDLEIKQVVEYTRRYQDRQYQPIAEGSPTQQLVPNTKQSLKEKKMTFQKDSLDDQSIKSR
ncbi:MAG TPA: hypothetical protein PKA00_01120 [Saprospiraceae bacterium]|nr:hypothetical protein [Saprospiraceae bacterium]HMQ81468.1 hypothetical protein [Saprospiraceae bacterium]